MGRNAIHEAGAILDVLRGYQARRAGGRRAAFREGLNAVGIEGGVAGNVIPDECVVTVNYRFAPDRSAEQAAEHVREVFAGWEVTITDAAGGARPGLGQSRRGRVLSPPMGGTPRAKLGWTDVARFDSLGVPGRQFRPRRPGAGPLARRARGARRGRQECEARMRAWLEGGPS